MKPLAAVALCAAVQFAFDLSYATIRGSAPGAGYLALAFGLTALAALAIGLLGAVLRLGSSVALLLWIAANAVAHASLTENASLRDGGLFVLMVAGAGVAAFGPSARAARDGLWSAVSPAAALTLGLTVTPPIYMAISVNPLIFGAVHEPSSIALTLWPAAIVVAIALVALALLSRLPRRVAGVPLFAAAGSVVMVLALAAVLVQELRTAPARRPVPPATATRDGALPNIVVLVLDTVRADHLSVYGYERPTTPQLERLLAENQRAVLYPLAFSPSNWTIPAHASLFTGVMPSEHGSHYGNMRIPNRPPFRWRATLGETLADRLGQAGYRTAALLANPYFEIIGGLDRGFQVWEQLPPVRGVGQVGEALRRRIAPTWYRKVEFSIATARVVNRSVRSFLEDCDEGGCFVVANYMEAHLPYAPERPFVGALGATERWPARPLKVEDDAAATAIAVMAYDEELLELDAAIGALVGDLRSRGLLDRTWLVITSDHGESFNEHGATFHASSIYNEQVRIPLIVMPPAGVWLPEPRGPVSLLDVTATLAAIGSGRTLGHGRDLRDPALPAAPVRVEFFGCGICQHKWAGPLVAVPAGAVVDGFWKLIDYAGERELYLLDVDPSERSDRAGLWVGEVERLALALPALERQPGAIEADPEPLSPEKQRVFRALGYVD